jgi:hypothetical protein
MAVKKKLDYFRPNQNREENNKNQMEQRLQQIEGFK